MPPMGTRNKCAGPGTLWDLYHDQPSVTRRGHMDEVVGLRMREVSYTTSLSLVGRMSSQSISLHDEDAGSSTAVDMVVI